MGPLLRWISRLFDSPTTWADRMIAEDEKAARPGPRPDLEPR